MKEKYPEVPVPPTQPPPTDTLRVLSPAEARTLDALTSRIIPGDAADPGAHEAHVVTYIDNMLAYHQGVVQPTYAEPPFAEKYTGSHPSTDTKDGYRVIWVKESELPRYGAQSRLTPLEQFRAGISAMDHYARSKHGGSFADLPPSQQDSVVEDMAGDKATGFTEPTSQAFFGMVRAATIQGFLSDPLYGGNRNMVGWKMVGYPGAQRAYTPHDLQNQHFHRQPQTMADLMPEIPGQRVGKNVILPESGSSNAVSYVCDHPNVAAGHEA
jgi:gluconate 2-dehydrogenase gamma chain